MINPCVTRAITFNSCPVYIKPIVSGGGTGGGGGGTTPDPGGGSNVPSGQGAQALIEKACYYMKNPSKYRQDMEKTFTDCYGFVVTVVRHSGVDPKAAVSPRAKEAIKSYYSKHADKYAIIHPVTGTKQLKPGDMLFNVDYGSHASLYVGPGYCGCRSGVISASLGDHGPQCSSWYGKMSWAVRVK